MYLAGKIILTLYLYCISYFYTLSVPVSWTAPIRLLVIYALVHYVCKWLSSKTLGKAENKERWNWRFGLLIFVMTVGIMGSYYAAYYPGGLTSDTFNQWYQVQKDYLLDWHPAIHTVLFLKLPSLIKNDLAFVNLVQIIWIGLAVSYLGMVLERWGIKKRWCTLALFISIAAPSSAIVMSYCWKDTALTIFVILLAGQMAEIFFSDGLWLKKWYHLALFSLFGGLASLMRHNAILLIAPLGMLIAILYWKQIRIYAIGAGIGILVVIAGIKGPVYRIMNVQNHPQVAAEMLGVPMTILANVLIHEPEMLDPEAREFLYQIGSQELWEENYTEGNWNSAKWMGDDISNDVIEEVGAHNVLLYTWHAVQKSPYYSYRAVVKLFEVVWKPFASKVSWSYSVNVDNSNSYGYETTGNAQLCNILDGIRNWSVAGGIYATWCWHIGFYILLLLFVGISRLKKNLQSCILWIPILCYDFGTALLLCGPDFRFFSFNTVVTIPLLLALLMEKNKEIEG
jgi:hypothetical protein